MSFMCETLQVPVSCDVVLSVVVVVVTYVPQEAVGHSVLIRPQRIGVLTHELQAVLQSARSTKTTAEVQMVSGETEIKSIKGRKSRFRKERKRAGLERREREQV